MGKRKPKFNKGNSKPKFQRSDRGRREFSSNYKKPNPSEKVDRAVHFHNSTKEDDIGITEYVTKAKGFTGIIKHRISDFHVNEISLDAQTSHLTDLTLPDPPKDITEAALDVETFKTQIGVENFNKIQEIEDGDKNSKDEVLIDVTSMEKNARTQIHHSIKEIFSNISSSTVEKDSLKHIRCTRQNKNRERRNRWCWPHEYTHFLLYKENIDTMQAVSLLAPLLNGTKASAITYAGTKDKRAKTTQWMCVRRREPSLIVRAARRLRNITIGNFAFREQALKLGQLKGNNFRIALRRISAPDDEVNSSMEKFKETGFINYYGLQRFGNHAAIPTHRIGLALLKADYKQASELIMQPRENDIPDMEGVRKCWWENRDAEEALSLINRNSRGGRGIEYKLLTGLARHGSTNFLAALDVIPRNTRLMYIHSYQSLIWNEMVSKRIAQFGLKVCEGDLVYADEITEVIEDGNTDDESDEESEESQTTEISPTNFQGPKVKVVSKEDVDSNSYSIFDIVLPLPGFDVQYPANECAAWYAERLAVDDLSSEKLKQKNKTYSLPGAYRKIIVRPIGLKWELMTYNDDTDCLIQSDLEALRKEKAPENNPNGQFKALVLDFSLPSSTYATMALREILKSDTSVASQVDLHEKASQKRPHEDNEADATEAKLPKVEAEEET